LSPLRIIIIAVLLYIGFRLITGGRKKSSSEQNANPDSQSDKPVQDVLMEDPICHSLVPKQQAIHLRHRGSMVYFCSEECCNTFIAQQGE
jgi:YHS domain-containing protein